MTKYMDPLLKILILTMFWVSVMRIRYIWTINKTGYKEPNLIFRNQEGDWTSILYIFIIITNQSRFDKFKVSYQPLLRHFYMIILGLFIINVVLQLTQFIVLTKTALITQGAIINGGDIKRYVVKKQIYGCKFIVDYTNKGKNRELSFRTTSKNKEVIEKRLQELNIKIV